MKIYSQYCKYCEFYENFKCLEEPISKIDMDVSVSTAYTNDKADIVAVKSCSNV